MPRKKLYFVLILIFIIFRSSDVQATDDILVRVCYDVASCNSPNDYNSDLILQNPYIEQVLANEWYANAEMEALKAGAIAIRTFSYRNPGCGAFLRLNSEPTPPYMSRLLNWAQVFRFGGYNGSQNTITSNHADAQSQTGSTSFFQATNLYACAKYNTDTGNPTKTCSSSVCPDAVDRVTLSEVPDPVSDRIGSKIDIGMAQNGSVAWERGSASWDYRQILTHYYKNILLANSSDTYYRWVWLNAGDDIVFTTSGKEYYGPINPTPDCLYVNGGAPVTIHVQNTSRQDWSLASTKLSYHWYNSSGNVVSTGAEVNLPSIPKGEDELITAALYPPTNAVAGQSYTLKWDLERGSTWFSSQNNWPTLNKTVCMLADTTPPHNPPQSNITSGSGHIQNGWASGPQISLTWSGASDGETWVSGYSIVWNQNGTTTPDTTQDISNVTATSGALSHGNWYLHVRARDNAGNWASGATHYGPYGVDTVPPQSQVSNSSTTPPGKSWLYLQIAGTDDGAGVASIAIQYKIDNGAWQNYGSVNGGESRKVLFTPSRYNRGQPITSALRLPTVQDWWEAWEARISS